MPESCPQPRQDCPYAGTPDCIVTTHHQYWPSPEYTTIVERFFREMRANRERLPWCEHEEVHATTDPPEKPNRDFMVGFILDSDVHIPSRVRKAIKRSGQS